MLITLVFKGCYETSKLSVKDGPDGNRVVKDIDCVKIPPSVGIVGVLEGHDHTGHHFQVPFVIVGLRPS